MTDAFAVSGSSPPGTVRIVPASEIPWPAIEQLATESRFPADGVIYRDATYAVLVADANQCLTGALLLRVDPERVRVRNVLLLGSTRVKLHRLSTLVEAARQLGASRGWSHWSVRLRREWTFYSTILHVLRAYGAHLEVVQGPDEFWTGKVNER